jgi:hypothetical protein
MSGLNFGLRQRIVHTKDNLLEELGFRRNDRNMAIPLRNEA